ncbi:MAG TPA: efflux RND transporter periplasmic adaptor subunit [Smithellaceae bacterium]|nr:efflux RND transporter periplasmic adaptor subunit [Smithellaceae bacterium]HQQ87266.1 efflux RND transporter periplasmic adaptor subunit [Smithellaceae bacterium]
MKITNRTGAVSTAVILFFCFILNGCGEQNMDGSPPPPEVAVVTTQLKEVVLTTELVGRTSAYLVAEVRPQVSGIIQKRLFKEGSDVRAGEVLFQIDPALYQAALARAEANLTALQLKANRFRELLAEKAVSQQDYDDVEAALKQTRAEVQTARINLNYTSITAPISGRIGKSNVTVGALVTAHQPMALATIQQLNPMYVDVTQSTADVLRLRRLLEEGQLNQNNKNERIVKLFLDDGTEYPLKGILQFRDVTVDPTTGSVTLRIVFPNPKNILLPGMFVRAVIPEGVNTKAILVPQQSISRDPKGNPYVFIVNAEGKVQQHQLTLDRAIGSDWLVSSGLTENEQVIVEGMLRIKPDDYVKAVPFETGTKNKDAIPPAETN